jgi:hypothetical protein
VRQASRSRSVRRLDQFGSTRRMSVRAQRQLAQHSTGRGRLGCASRSERSLAVQQPAVEQCARVQAFSGSIRCLHLHLQSTTVLAYWCTGVRAQTPVRPHRCQLLLRLLLLLLQRCRNRRYSKQAKVVCGSARRRIGTNQEGDSRVCRRQRQAIRASGWKIGRMDRQGSLSLNLGFRIFFCIKSRPAAPKQG